MRILEGRQISQQILKRVKEDIGKLERQPGLAALLVGNNKASEMYIDLKKKTAHACGILFSDYRLPKESTEEDVLEVIQHLNQDSEVDGILVQLPLPDHLDREKILNTIDPRKDVDGLTDKNQLCMFDESDCFLCPFPQAIILLLQSALADFGGKQIMVIANSKEFGQVMRALFMQRGADVKFVLSRERHAHREDISRADVIITATGISQSLTESEVKDGCIIIDGGIEKVGEKVCGDADIDGFANRDVIITPVPGGVGPVTVACLMENTYLAAKRRRNA